MIISPSFLLRMRNISDKSCRKNKNTSIYSTIFRKVMLFIDIIVEYVRPMQNTDDNIIWRMPFACWTTKGYIQRLRICNTYCFFTATTVVRRRLNVALRVQWLSCLTSNVPFVY